MDDLDSLARMAPTGTPIKLVRPDGARAILEGDGTLVLTRDERVDVLRSFKSPN